MAKLNHVLVSQLQVSAIGHLVVVENRTIRTFQINKVRLDSADLVSVFISFLRVTKLDYGMLFADARMLGRQVHHRNFSSY